MGNIVTNADLEAQNITPSGLTDEAVRVAESYVEQVTGFRFYSHNTTYYLNGNGSSVLLLPNPVISLTTIAENQTTMEAGSYLLYNSRPPGRDDRLYPKIAKPTAYQTLISATASFFGSGIWPLGDQNVVLTGTFGFTELVGDDELPPPEIVMATMRLVKHELDRIGLDHEQSARRARKFGSTFQGAGLMLSLHERGQSDGPSGDYEVDSILSRYRHPNQGTRAGFVFA